MRPMRFCATKPNARPMTTGCWRAATATTGHSQASATDHLALIEQLQKNALDEIVVVELYEKFFGCKVKIINGWINSYAVQSGKKAIHLDFVKLKSRIIEHLEQL